MGRSLELSSFSVRLAYLRYPSCGYDGRLYEYCLYKTDGRNEHGSHDFGQRSFGLLFAYILSSGGAKFSSFSGGAMGGAVVGLLMSLSYDSMIYAQSTMMNSFTGVIMDVVAFAIISAIAGGGIGWWLGRK